MNKTVPTGASVAEFIAGVADETKRADSIALVELMEDVTGEPAVMWGDSIIGFGDFMVSYSSGRKVQWVGAGFSPRKKALSIYLSLNLNLKGELLDGLGPHTTGVGCLYIKRLADVDLDVLRRLVAISMDATRAMAESDPTA